MKTFSEVIHVFWDERQIVSTRLDVYLDPLIEGGFVRKHWQNANNRSGRKIHVGFVLLL
jgi:hypothetical protein